jgi:hypothetical protein
MKAEGNKNQAVSICFMCVHYAVKYACMQLRGAALSLATHA